MKPPLRVLLVLVPALVPVATALDVHADAEGGLIVHVTRDAPGRYAVEADARARVEWVGPEGKVTVLDLSPDAPAVLELAPGRHAFTVTHATRAGWLLVVPEDAAEPGAALAFERARPLGLWLGAHAWSLLAAGGLVAAAAAGGRWLHEKA